MGEVLAGLALILLWHPDGLAYYLRRYYARRKEAR